MLSPWTIIGGLLLLIAAAFGGERVGVKLERQAWQAKQLITKDEHIAKLTEKAKEYAKDLDDQRSKERKASENHEKALASLDQKYRTYAADLERRGGMRITIPKPACSGPAPTTEAPGASGPHDEATQTVRIPGSIERDLSALAHRADQVVEQCRALQDWIRDNGLYGPQE